VEGIGILRGAIGGMKKGYSQVPERAKRDHHRRRQAFVASHISAANAAGVAIEAEVANRFHLGRRKITYMQNYHDTRPFDPFVNQKLD